MNQTRNRLSSIWTHFQTTLFPFLQEELGGLTDKQKQLVEVLELVQIETHLPYVGRVPGRPSKSRSAIARAFVAKAVYNMPTTEVLRDPLESNIKLRRLCGWEKRSDLPSSATFSRAFAEFAVSQLAERVHAAVIKRHLGDQLIGHISRDSTAIVAREKTLKPEVKKESPPKKRGRPKKGEKRIKEPTRLEKQSAGMSLTEMKEDLPIACNVGTKRIFRAAHIDWVWVPVRTKTKNAQYLVRLMREYSFNASNRNNSHFQNAQMPLML